MNPSAGVAAWQKPAKPLRGRARKVAARERGRARSRVSTSPGSSSCGRCTPIRVERDVRSPSRAMATTTATRPTIRRRLWCSRPFGIGTRAGDASACCLLPRRRALHGDARFATRREIAAAGLLGTRASSWAARDDAVSCSPASRAWRSPLPRGRARAPASWSPMRSTGPGRWSASTSSARTGPDRRLSRALAARPATSLIPSPRTAAPRAGIRSPTSRPIPQRRLNDLQRIAEMLYPDPPNVDPFWTASARSLFLGIALYLFETPSLPKTIGEVLRQGMASDDEGFGQHWKRLIEGRNSGTRPLSPAVRARALRRDRSGARDRELDPQDLHESPGSLAEPDPGCGDLGE